MRVTKAEIDKQITVEKFLLNEIFTNRNMNLECYNMHYCFKSYVMCPNVIINRLTAEGNYVLFFFFLKNCLREEFSIFCFLFEILKFKIKMRGEFKLNNPYESRRAEGTCQTFFF